MHINQKYGISITKQLDSYKARIYMDSLVSEFEFKEECIDYYLSEDVLGLVLVNKVVIYSIAESKIIDTILGQYKNIVLGEKKQLLAGNGSIYELKNYKVKKSIKCPKEGLMRIDGNILAVGGYDIALIDLNNYKTIKTFGGHATKINQLILTSQYLYSSALEDRFISQWNIKDGSCQSFVVESCPLQLHANETHLMAFLENGKIALWETSKSGPNQGVVELHSQDQEDAAFISAGLDETFLIVAYGSDLKPTFERISFLDEDGNIKPELILTRFSKQEQKKKKSKSKPQVLSALSVQEPDVEPLPIQEISIEEQLKQMLPSEPVTTKKMTQTSLQQLLTQALHSGDVELLEKALTVSDKKIINATIQKMNPVHIIPLLDQLVVRLQKRPTRAHMLIEWIRASLLHHSGYLLSVPHLTHRLGSLYRTLNARQETMSKLLKLSGRLDMVASQMETFVSIEEEDVIVFDADGEEDEMDTDSFSDDDEMIEE